MMAFLANSNFILQISHAKTFKMRYTRCRYNNLIRKKSQLHFMCSSNFYETAFLRKVGLKQIDQKVRNGHFCDLKYKFFLGGFKYWDESRPSREDYRSGLHHGNKSLTAWPNPVKTNNKLHHLCYYYYMLEVIQNLNFRSGIYSNVNLWSLIRHALCS